MAVVSVNDPHDETTQLRLKDQPEPSSPGRGLAARRQQSWASRWERGQGGRPSAAPGDGWEVFSYLVSGMLVYGGIGWLVGRAVHVGLLFPVGMAVGLAIALGWIIYHYGGVGRDRE
jgi:hypothetical protein